MSMINTSDKSIKNSPFNDLASGSSKPENPFDGISLKDAVSADRLSTRSSIFTALVLVAVCFMVPSYAGDSKAFLVSVAWAVAAAVAYVLFWTVTFRLFESPDTMPASVVLNLVPSIVAFIFLKERVPLEGSVLIAAGLSALTLISRDETKKPARKANKAFRDVDFLNGELIGYSEFIKADVVHEVLLPLLFALISSVAGVVLSAVISSKTGMTGKSLSILIASLVLVLISWLISSLRGKDYLLSSASLSDSSELPSLRYRSLRSFLLRRLRFFLSIVILGSGSLLTDYLNTRFTLGLWFMKYVICALMLFVFAFLRGRHSKHRIQFVAELCIIYALGICRCNSILDIVIVVLLSLLVDILITGLTLTHNRRLIMSGRSRFVEGMPLELMSAALIFMACEVLLGYWGIALL